MKRLRLTALLALAVPAAILAAEATATADDPRPPDVVVPEDPLTVAVEKVGTMPFVLGPNLIIGGPDVQNLQSPVAIGDKLFLIDHNDAIYRAKENDKHQLVFDVSEAPDGLELDNRQSILNISPGSEDNVLYVMFEAGNDAPPAGVPNYPLPDPLPGDCCLPGAPIPVEDLYRIGTVPGPAGFFVPTRTEYQVLYEYKLAGNKLKEPRAIASIETQSGPTHNGGGMVTLPDGRVLFATGDALPFGADGRTPAQDPDETVSKLLIIDPADGSIEVAAVGVRNVQHLEITPDGTHLAFGDIGGVTAEEVNYVPLADLVDTSTIENFGWGRGMDGLAREGTFYIAPGLPLVFATEPPVLAAAPSPESGYIQPQAQYGRNDAGGLGGVAVSGPVTSDASFDTITGLFSDLASGIAYATTAPRSDTDTTVFKVDLLDEAGNALDSFNELFGDPNVRVDPRFFRFPDGTAGVLLEASGDFYRLTEVPAD